MICRNYCKNPASSNFISWSEVSISMSSRPFKSSRNASETSNSAISSVLWMCTIRGASKSIPLQVRIASASASLSVSIYIGIAPAWMTVAVIAFAHTAEKSMSFRHRRVVMSASEIPMYL